jgi:DNA polymerase V
MFSGMSYKGDNTTGFQSPAQDYTEDGIDLVRELDVRKPSVFLTRFISQAIRERGILPGDVLITDRAAEHVDGMVCVAFCHGERALGLLVRHDGQWCIKRAGRDPLTICEDVEVWGRVIRLARLRV